MAYLVFITAVFLLYVVSLFNGS